MATRRSSRRNPNDFSKPLFPNSCFLCGKTSIQQNKKSIVPKKILTLLAEAITKATDKDNMCDFYFTNKDFDLIAHDVLCHHLATNIFLSATAAVSEKLLQ